MALNQKEEERLQEIRQEEAQAEKDHKNAMLGDTDQVKPDAYESMNGVVAKMDQAMRKFDKMMADAYKDGVQGVKTMGKLGDAMKRFSNSFNSAKSDREQQKAVDKLDKDLDDTANKNNLDDNNDNDSRPSSPRPEPQNSGRNDEDEDQRQRAGTEQSDSEQAVQERGKEAAEDDTTGAQNDVQDNRETNAVTRSENNTDDLVERKEVTQDLNDEKGADTQKADQATEVGADRSAMRQSFDQAAPDTNQSSFSDEQNDSSKDNDFNLGEHATADSETETELNAGANQLPNPTRIPGVK